MTFTLGEAPTVVSCQFFQPLLLSAHCQHRFPEAATFFSGRRMVILAPLKSNNIIIISGKAGTSGINSYDDAGGLLAKVVATIATKQHRKQQRKSFEMELRNTFYTGYCL